LAKTTLKTKVQHSLQQASSSKICPVTQDKEPAGTWFVNRYNSF